MRTDTPSITTSEQGFTLIELLVVILIIGVLAGIAIPSFLNQTSKATDASAKSLARSASTAAETYGTDHNGSYTGLDATSLKAVEFAIPITATGNDAYLTGAATPAASGTSTGSNGNGTSYSVTTTSASGNSYTIARNDQGIVTRTCTTAGTGPRNGGCVSGTW